jgi:hypothetical protein
MILSANTHILGIMTEGITVQMKSAWTLRKNVYQICLLGFIFQTTGLITSDVWKMMFVFYFSSILDYMYLFPTMNYTRSCCLACKYFVHWYIHKHVPIKPGETKFTTNFGYLEHPDILKFFRGPSNFEIEVFYCIETKNMSIHGNIK